MANRVNLIEYQDSIAAKLQQVKQAGTAQTPSKLGVQVGNQAWLFNLDDVSEVLPVPELVPVPLTQPWFPGVVNVRGNLYSIVDFAAFLGLDATPVAPFARLMLIHPKYRINSALLVQRMLGLRGADQLHAADQDQAGSHSKKQASADTRWVKEKFKDDEGRLWKQIDVKQLITDPEFLQISL